MSESTLNGLLETVWSLFEQGQRDRSHPARHPSLATTGPDGPSARTVVLRGVNRIEGALEFHTDALSPKCDHIRKDPRVAIHVWCPDPSLQLRLTAVARLEPGDPAVFAKLLPQAQINYGGAAPGTPLDEADPATPTGDPARFLRVICKIETIDVLHLDTPTHRRALFARSDGWSGAWITP